MSLTRRGWAVLALCAPALWLILPISLLLPSLQKARDQANLVRCSTQTRAISLGTAAGGWRIIRTMGQGVVKLDPIHGFGADMTSWMFNQGASNSRAASVTRERCLVAIAKLRLLRSSAV